MLFAFWEVGYVPVFCTVSWGWSGPLRLSKSPWNDDMFMANNRYPKSQSILHFPLATILGGVSFTFQAVYMYVLIRWALKMSKILVVTIIRLLGRFFSNLKFQGPTYWTLRLIHVVAWRRAKKFGFFSMPGLVSQAKLVEGFCKHYERWQFIEWLCGYLEVTILPFASNGITISFLLGRCYCCLGGNDLIWRGYFSQLGRFNHQL